jgi:hypothetical protein
MVKTYQTMRTAPKTKHTIQGEQLQKQNILNHENTSKNKTYQIMRTVPKQNIPYHENSSKNKTYHTMKTAPKTKHIIP